VFGPGGRTGQKPGRTLSRFFIAQTVLPLLDHNTFWLSVTPETPGTKFPDSALPRIVTWGKFQDRRAAGKYFILNTHFDHLARGRGRSGSAVSGAGSRRSRAGILVVVTGDFNATDQEPPYQTMTGLLADGRKISTSAAGSFGTTRDFDSIVKDAIDYVFGGPAISRSSITRPR